MVKYLGQITKRTLCYKCVCPSPTVKSKLRRVVSLPLCSPSLEVTTILNRVFLGPEAVLTGVREACANRCVCASWCRPASCFRDSRMAAAGSFSSFVSLVLFYFKQMGHSLSLDWLIDGHRGSANFSQRLQYASERLCTYKQVSLGLKLHQLLGLGDVALHLF